MLAPVLFNLFFTQALLHAVKDLVFGLYIKYRFDVSLFDLPRLSARTKTLQLIVDRFADAARLFGSTISLGKTVNLVQPAPNTMRPQPAITINGVRLKCVDSFKYLGSEISADGSLDREITSRIQKASHALGRLGVKVLRQKGITLLTSLKIYKAVVLSSHLYGCETWTMYRRHAKQLEHFHNNSLSRIL